MDPFRFESTIIYWRGPSPFFYAPLPQDLADEVQRMARSVTYGWGMIPVDATIKNVTWYTALFPKDGTYLLPIKAAVRRKADVTVGDMIAVAMTLKPGGRRG